MITSILLYCHSLLALTYISYRPATTTMEMHGSIKLKLFHFLLTLLLIPSGTLLSFIILETFNVVIFPRNYIL